MFPEPNITVIDIEGAQADLDNLVHQTLAGQQVRISVNGISTIELAPVEDVVRVPGTLKGEIWVSKDFDDYSDDISSLFE